jgi:hypothetical protein
MTLAHALVTLGDTLARGLGGQRGFEQLAHQREGEVALQLGRTGGQDVEPRPFRDLARGAQQERLAQSHRRLDHDQPARSRRRLADGRLQLAQLRLTLQQHAGGGWGGTRRRHGSPPLGPALMAVATLLPRL